MMLDDLIKDYKENLEKKRIELLNSKENYNLNIRKKIEEYQKKGGFFNKIYLRITGKEQENMEKIQMLEEEKATFNKKIEEEINDVEKNISGMNNIDNVVYLLYNEKPELFNNVLFMKELIMVDLKYIVYDKTNNEELYKEFANEMIKFVKNNETISNNNKDIQIEQLQLEQLHFLIEELNNPKKPVDGTYKIPHEFLFELVRNQILCGIVNNSDMVSELQFSYYFLNDCKYTLSYGKKLEELYLNPNINLYYAGTDNSEIIFKEGYQINYGGDLSRNFWDAHAFECGFTSILPVGGYGRDEKIFAAVPKDAKNILGSDGEVGRYGMYSDYGYEFHTYLRPEYIIGCNRYVDGEAVFVENPIPIDERCKYKNYGDAYISSSDFIHTDRAISEMNNSVKSR